jgi:hypothetical protein
MLVRTILEIRMFHLRKTPVWICTTDGSKYKTSIELIQYVDYNKDDEPAVVPFNELLDYQLNRCKRDYIGLADLYTFIPAHRVSMYFIDEESATVFNTCTYEHVEYARYIMFSNKKDKCSTKWHLTTGIMED